MNEVPITAEEDTAMSDITDELMLLINEHIEDCQKKYKALKGFKLRVISLTMDITPFGAKRKEFIARIAEQKEKEQAPEDSSIYI